MATTQITVGGQPLTIVKVPGEDAWQQGAAGLWFRSAEFSIEDAIATTKTPYASNSQTFEFPGAEEWYGQCELPQLDVATAGHWRAFLAQCRGMLHPFLLGDPSYPGPGEDGLGGRIDGSSQAVCDTAFSATANLPMSKYLQIRGLKPNAARLLLAGSYLQVGYRLVWLCDDLPKADSQGRAVAEVWPSLREQPADGEPIITRRPRGLFRLASNKRTWSADYTQLSSMSVPVMEWLG